MKSRLIDTDEKCLECEGYYPRGEPLLCDCWMGTKEQEDYLNGSDDE